MQYFTLLTAKGAEKIAAATAANTTVDLTHIALGDGNGSVVMPDASKTALVNEVYRASLNDLRVDTNNANWVVAESNVPSNEGNFWVREVGVFDVDGDLIAIGNYPETFKPVTADGVAKDLYMKVIFEVSSSDAVTLQVDPSVVMASQEFVNERLKDKSSTKHNHDDKYLKFNTGNSVTTTPNNLLKGIGLFFHSDCPNATENWYIIAINYTESENGASMQLAISYSSTVPKMYVRTKHYTKTTWQSWTRTDNADSAISTHNHDKLYLGINDKASDSAKFNGLQSDYYLGLVRGTITIDPNLTLYNNILSNHANTPDSNYYWYITTTFYSAINVNSSRMQIAVQYSGGDKVFVRNKYSTNEFGPWREIGKKIKRLAYSGTKTEGQHGFSSVVRTQQGWYDCYFSSPMPNTNYSVVTSVLGSDFVVGYSKYTDKVRINRIHSSDNIYYDGGFSIAILEDV